MGFLRTRLGIVCIGCITALIQHSWGKHVANTSFDVAVFVFWGGVSKLAEELIHRIKPDIW